MSDQNEEKTYRIAWLCGTLVMLGFLLFLFKVDACKDGCTTACQDSFHQLPDNAKDNTPVTCDHGAKAELITSPPAPHAGVICHCADVVHNK